MINSPMQRLILWITLLSLAGCTTLRPIDVNSAQPLKAGDRVSIVTTDNRNHAFKVTEIAPGVIKGRAIEIPVDRVASVSKREFSTGKTVALVALSLLAVGGLVAIVAAHTAPAFALQ